MRVSPCSKRKLISETAGPSGLSFSYINEKFSKITAEFWSEIVNHISQKVVGTPALIK